MSVERLLRHTVKTIQAYSSARDDYKDTTEGMVFLDANENPFSTDVNRYPDPQQSKLKVRLSELKGLSVDNILLGNGSDEILDLIFRAFCEPYQDNVIILPPTYGMYAVLAELNAVEIIRVDLSEMYEPRVEAILESQNEHSKLLFLCSPNNPSANSFDAEKVEALINNFNGIVVMDEAYIDFSKQDSWLNRLDEFENLIITQTLSKAYGMAGIRLGICYASKFIISILNKIKPPYNVNELTQQRAIERLSRLEVVAHEVTRIIEERERLDSELRTIALITKVYPSDANFILVKVDNANLRYTQLLNNGIVVRNRTSQPLCDNCLRFTIGTREENDKLLKTLKKLK
jgi:histidinol-phosphate aminotransferase